MPVPTMGGAAWGVHLISFLPQQFYNIIAELCGGQLSAVLAGEFLGAELIDAGAAQSLAGADAQIRAAKLCSSSMAVACRVPAGHAPLDWASASFGLCSWFVV